MFLLPYHFLMFQVEERNSRKQEKSENKIEIEEEKEEVKIKEGGNRGKFFVTDDVID